MDNPGCTMLNLGDFFFQLMGPFVCRRRNQAKLLAKMVKNKNKKKNQSQDFTKKQSPGKQGT